MSLSGNLSANKLCNLSALTVMRDMTISAVQGYVTQAHMTHVGTQKRTTFNILQTKESLAY